MQRCACPQAISCQNCLWILFLGSFEIFKIEISGNLTKHILKHHKKEQNDYIGTDDIIIKKGKKSVKDPAAIDFLEKSMIVLNGGNRTGSAAGSHSGSSTPLPGASLNAPSIEEQQRCFLMSLGLEPGSIDLKVESPDSDSSMGEWIEVEISLWGHYLIFGNLER